TSPPGSSASTPATGDALFCGVGSSWFEDLGNMPNGALLDALDRTVAGAVGDDILTLTGHSIRA
ncbi:MAG: hypothetical protein OXH69_09065, partial [Acidobacteria bacterium]|nr:hypothetical protein [Acidobacteriota bacterium]